MSYNKEQNKEYLRARYASQKQMFIDYLDGKCIVCNTSNDLEFDHVNWKDKSFDISRLWAKKDLPKVFKELNKCQLLCKKHHLEKTKKDLTEITLSKGFSHGTYYAFSKRKCVCVTCDAARQIYNEHRANRRRTHAGRGSYRRPYFHGTVRYYKKGCKCSECRAANSNYVRNLRNK